MCLGRWKGSIGDPGSFGSVLTSNLSLLSHPVAIDPTATTFFFFTSTISALSTVPSIHLYLTLQLPCHSLPIDIGPNPSHSFQSLQLTRGSPSISLICKFTWSLQRSCLPLELKVDL